MTGVRHVPVLLDEIVEVARGGPHRIVLDGTVGLGGHAAALLSRLPGLERYIGLDRDAEALELAQDLLTPFRERVRLFQATFDQAQAILDQLGLETVDLALLDLGVSSLQLDRPGRGFSFRDAGPLDMRMDPSHGETAKDLLGRLTVGELTQLLKTNGEVDCPGRVARAILENLTRIKTTADLAQVVVDVLPASLKARSRIHPATKVFLALRIAVNQELERLETALPAILERLSCDGRIAAIAFHSLEDRIVKRFFSDEARGCTCPPGLPVCACGRRPRLRLCSRRAIQPAPFEQQANPRSRSAKLRVGVRL